MPIVYLSKKQNPLLKEPYISFDNKFLLLENLHGSEIELSVGTDKKGKFENGFYSSEYAYQQNKKVRFIFERIKADYIEKSDSCSEDCTYVRCIYSFGYDTIDDLEYHLMRLQAFELRTDYFYIPKADLECYYAVDAEKVKIYIEALVMDEKDVQQVCRCILNQLIAIFSLED